MLVRVRDTVVTQTASEGPGWSGLGSQSTRPSLQGRQGRDTGGFPEKGLCELRPEGRGEVHWVGISIWLRLALQHLAQCPAWGRPQHSESRDPVRTLVSGSTMRPGSPWLSSRLLSREQGVRAERPPSPAQRWGHRWAAIQENRFGSRSPVGGGWGPKQPTCLNWPGPPGQQVARARALPGEQTWPGSGALCPSLLSTPTKPGAPSVRLPPSSPQNTVHSTLPGLGDPDQSRSPSRLLCPRLPCSSSSSTRPYTPTLPHLPRRAPPSPARPGPTASCLPRFAPIWLQAQPHSSPWPLSLCLPIPTPQPVACGPQVSSEPSAGQD